MFVALDNHAKRFIKYVPSFVKSFADSVPKFLFNILVFFRMAEFSGDIEKAGSFRSKVIWEEAKRRGIIMEQVIFRGKPLDQYRAMLNINGKDKYFYFESIPIRPEFSDMEKNWDDKVVMKKEFKKHGLPVPVFAEFTVFSLLRPKKLEKIFSKFKKPVIIKPRVGSRGRHTITNIHNFTHFRAGAGTAGRISFHLIAEEHLSGFVCRATVVNGKLSGFYRGSVPQIRGDGQKTIRRLIEKKNRGKIDRYHVRADDELFDYLKRSGWNMDDILPAGTSISLSHRRGQLFGGETREMIDELHPSFIPIFEKAAKLTSLPVVGFDAIIPDPEKHADSQTLGIIECNSLPFIDMHYFALEGKPRDIAGMIWDMWE